MVWKDKIALVTGGGTGIGRETSEQLAESGATVVINYNRSETAAKETVKRIKNAGGNSMLIKADITNEHEVVKMIDAVIQSYGKIDFLVNNAGMTHHVPYNDLEALTNQTWQSIFDVNVMGMFYCIKAVAPYMKKNKSGAIINIGSTSGQTGQGSSIPYAVSKSAVHGMTKSMSIALAPHIDVNAVAPGMTLTRWWHELEDNIDENIAEKAINPKHVGELICSILKQKSMTGQIITINKGQ